MSIPNFPRQLNNVMLCKYFSWSHNILTTTVTQNLTSEFGNMKISFLVNSGFVSLKSSLINHPNILIQILTSEMNTSTWITTDFVVIKFGP